LPWKDPPFLIGKPSINGPFSMAMLNNQRVSPEELGDCQIVLFRSFFLGHGRCGRWSHPEEFEDCFCLAI
jgi:hypothetical protein